MYGPLRIAAFLILASAAAQAQECRLFKVAVPSINVSSEPREDSTFIDVLDSGETACVTRSQRAAGRSWLYVAHVVGTGPRKVIDGWVQETQLQPVGTANAPAPATAAPSPAPAAPRPAAPASPPRTAPAPAPATASKGNEETLRFNEPIPFGPFPVNGATIEQLANGVPLFPPIEDLDEQAWKLTCASCHVWTRGNLCEQGGTYAKNPRNALRNRHPYGGGYKIALMRWAKTGCQ